MEVSGSFSMEKLPIELKLKIMECSTGIDLAKLECVNSEWRALIRSSGNLWEKMCYKMMEKLPDSLKLKELPPEGLNWKELCILWTVLLRNKLRFCWFFRLRDVNALDNLFYEALPQRSPVRYYTDFADGAPSRMIFLDILISELENLVYRPNSDSSSA